MYNSLWLLMICFHTMIQMKSLIKDFDVRIFEDLANNLKVRKYYVVEFRY